MNAETQIVTGSELVIFEKRYTPAALFVPGACEPLLAYIKAEVKKEIIDASTEAGRSEIKRLAFKVKKTKTAIEAARVELVGAEKKRLAAIDAEGKHLRDELDELAKVIRQPVTDFENREKERVAKHEENLATLKALGEPHFLPDAEGLSEFLANLLRAAEAFDVSGFEEFAAIAANTKAQVVENLTARLTASRKADADRAELARLRKEQAEREQREREERIAAQAKAEAEAAAKRREEEAARKAAEEIARVEREKKEAEERAAQAERDRFAAAERAERERLEAECRAAEEKVRAEAEAKRREEEAAERERQRIAAQQKAEAEAAAAREADKVHKAEVNNEALADLMAAGLSEDDGKKAIAAIAKHTVRHVAISY